MNQEPCGGQDNVDDGCGMVFQWRSSTGHHCQLCNKLKVPGLSEDLEAEIRVTTSLLSKYMGSTECQAGKNGPIFQLWALWYNNW